jgi:hypothetical protein
MVSSKTKTADGPALTSFAYPPAPQFASEGGHSALACPVWLAGWLAVCLAGLLAGWLAASVGGTRSPLGGHGFCRRYPIPPWGARVLSAASDPLLGSTGFVGGTRSPLGGTRVLPMCLLGSAAPSHEERRLTPPPCLSRNSGSRCMQVSQRLGTIFTSKMQSLQHFGTIFTCMGRLLYDGSRKGAEGGKNL